MSDFLVATGISKRFGAHQALDRVDLRVGEDELLVVLGPTGAGKTTLLRALAGLESPDAGSVSMAGRDVTAAAPAERDVALVFQNFSLYPGWSVRRNLEFPLRAPGRNMPETAIAERIAWAAKLLRIEALLDKPAQRLSGGQMQRVAIGRAIVRRPRLFLMDEPLTNLDAKLREALRVELVLLRRELRAPMVYVTHDQAEALSMADRVVVIERGRILQQGTPEEVYRRPATPAVARQLGQPAINLFAARRAGNHWNSGGVDLLPASGEASAATVGVRPEDLALAGGASEGVVRVVEDLGPTRLAVIDWAGQHCHALLAKDRAVAVGERVAPSFAPERALVWPAERANGG
jgi:multiple sugar transport system ATP-binding protein